MKFDTNRRGNALFNRLILLQSHCLARYVFVTFGGGFIIHIRINK